MAYNAVVVINLQNHNGIVCTSSYNEPVNSN